MIFVSFPRSWCDTNRGIVWRANLRWQGHLPYWICSGQSLYPCQISARLDHSDKSHLPYNLPRSVHMSNCRLFWPLILPWDILTCILKIYEVKVIHPTVFHLPFHISPDSLTFYLKQIPTEFVSTKYVAHVPPLSHTESLLESHWWKVVTEDHFLICTLQFFTP